MPPSPFSFGDHMFKLDPTKTYKDEIIELHPKEPPELRPNVGKVERIKIVYFVTSDGQQLKFNFRSTLLDKCPNTLVVKVFADNEYCNKFKAGLIFGTLNSFFFDKKLTLAKCESHKACQATEAADYKGYLHTIKTNGPDYRGFVPKTLAKPSVKKDIKPANDYSKAANREIRGELKKTGWAEVMYVTVGGCEILDSDRV